MTHAASVAAPAAGVVWRLRPLVLGGLAVGGAYYAGAMVGFALTPPAQPVSTFWPPNAILLGALLLAPPRAWPWLLLAALPAHLAVELRQGVPLAMVLSWFASNSSEALIGAGGLRWLSDQPTRFDSFRRVTLFVALGALAAPFLSSFLDAAFVRWNDWGSQSYWEVWNARFFSNVIAILALVPVIVTLGTLRAEDLRRISPRRAAEAVVLGSGLLVASAAAFFGTVWALEPAHMLLFAGLPFLLWAAVRFGPGGASLSLLVFVLVSIWGAVRGHGPFVDWPVSENTLSLQLFLILIYLPVLGLAAAVRERANVEERARRTLTLANATLREEIEIRVQIEQALRASEERFATAFRASPDAIAIARQDGLQLIEVNEQWEAMFGYTRDEAIGRTLDELGILPHPDDRHWLSRVVAAQGSVRELELDLCDRAGAPLIGVLTIETVEMGGEPCLIAMIRDITERRRAEHVVEMQRRQLAHLGRVALVGELSGALAHELNQPLAAILANASAANRLLASGRVNADELRGILNDIVADDQRAGAVIRRVRALIRKGDVERQWVDANELVNEVLELARRDLVERHVSVSTGLSATVPLVLADRVQLQQVLLNLIVNACDAMAEIPPAERTLSIATHADGGGVHLEVTDHGTGIAAADVDTVFEPFVTAKEHGLGLGLTICRSIVHAHGGRMWANNGAQGGATFHVLLPRRSAAPGAVVLLPHAAPGAHAEPRA